MRPLTVLLGILAAAAMVALAAEVSSTAQLTSRIQQEVVTPGKLVRSDLPGALAAGGDTLSDSVARTDPLSEKAWDLTVNARENWYAAETPEAFAAYMSAAEALLAADNLAMVPRTGETGYLTAADRHFASSEATARQVATATGAPQQSAAVTDPGTPQAPPPAPPPSTDTVYVTNSGSKYHSSGCRYLKSSISISRAEAIQQGYTPCKVCNP